MQKLASSKWIAYAKKPFGRVDHVTGLSVSEACRLAWHRFSSPCMLTVARP